MSAVAQSCSYDLSLGSIAPKDRRQVCKGMYEIIRSIGWIERDWQIAHYRVNNDRDIKVLAKNASGVLAGYAIIVLEEYSWYISQIAVAKCYQRQGIGSLIMRKIFEEANHRRVSSVILDADAKELKTLDFYRSFAPLVRSIKIEEQQPGSATIPVTYILSSH